MSGTNGWYGNQSDPLGKVGWTSTPSNDQPLEQRRFFGQELLQPIRRGITQAGDQGCCGCERAWGKGAFGFAQFKVKAARRGVISCAAEGCLGRLTEQLSRGSTRDFRPQPSALVPISVDEAIERAGMGCGYLAGAPGASYGSWMGFEKRFRIALRQHLTSRPRHIDAPAKLIQALDNGADARRFC